MTLKGRMRSDGEMRISVTEVRNALRCPRVFAIGRASGRAVTFPIGASTLGSLFHRICEQFARNITAPPQEMARLDAAAPREDVVRAISRWLLQFLLKEIKANERALMNMSLEVDDLAEALRRLAGYLAEQIEPTKTSPAEALKSMVKYPEQSFESTISLKGGQIVTLTGRIDAVYDRIGSPFDIVEYKLSDEADEELDSAQAALYTMLVHKNLNIQGEAVILRFNPGLIIKRVLAEATDSLLQRKLLPLMSDMANWVAHPQDAPATLRKDLCAVCPVRKECGDFYCDQLAARDFPPANARRPRPSPNGSIFLGAALELPVSKIADPQGNAEAEVLSGQIIDQFKKQGVTVHVGSRTVGPTLIQIVVTVGARHRVSLLDSAARDVEHHLTERKVQFRKDGAVRSFQAPRTTPRKVEMLALLAHASEFLKEKPGRFILGEKMEGDVLCGDLSDGTSSHLLIAGQTGSGKSVLLRGIVSSLCHYHPPSAIRFTLCDPKRVTFERFSNAISTHLAGPIRYNSEEILPELETLVTEMEYRFELFQQAVVQDIDEYNEGRDEILPRRVLVVDEFQDLIIQKSGRQQLIELVHRLGTKARAAGIHLILATQRPDKNTVPGEIKANLGGRVALKVQAAVNSRIILDEAGAEDLLGAGDLLANLGKGIVRAQAPLA